MAAGGSLPPLALGERVIVRHLGIGTVVGILDRGEYASHLSAYTWAALGRGALIEFDDGSIIHVREPTSNIHRCRLDDAAGNEALRRD